MPAASLTALLEALARADSRIANLAGTVRTAEEGPAVRARTVITAIETRNRIAAAVLTAIALEDQALHARASCTGTISRIPRRDRSLTLHARASCTRARIPAGVKTVIFLPDNGRGGTRPPWIDPNRSKNRTKPNQNEPTRDARE